ncbi:ABC transporter ATP-binding protein [Lederbergia galactosidilytica]|uniref:ABC transporter n=1 Tax=Lederbergia galactosidilytica TaxID=217031 RepID=A0A0Q9Y0B5_9BACI|nr:ABC transporter ATP-binding protein [Lederbergia galactosidilytica]KRG14422.1 ABC transporter [Lederbergia galactosidilytica]KRG14831.1 ABC transporter [Virgibacillus soli]MBP1914503.1 NitT/TauT family transport system ATP-binding protein [Lederbergia galactosidilytica]OAK69079.1 ABC transporter [Lederbergia galactosidilytica]
MIQVKEVSKSFHKSSASNQVIDNISFEVKKGEIVTLLGKSGCGKSTLLNIIGGFTTADSGNVFVDEHKVTRPKRNCITLFQHRNLLPWRSVQKNVELGLEKEDLSVQERRVRALNAIELVGLKANAQQFPHELSGGMQQRVAIARAFAMKPDVILMDEPFAALDTFNRYHLQDQLLKIQEKEKSTILLVTHDIDEAVYLSDRILIMSAHPGKIYKDLKIELSKPRDRTTNDFHYFRKRILDEFELSGIQNPMEYMI